MRRPLGFQPFVAGQGAPRGSRADRSPTAESRSRSDGLATARDSEPARVRSSAQHTTARAHDEAIERPSLDESCPPDRPLPMRAVILRRASRAWRLRALRRRCGRPQPLSTKGLRSAASPSQRRSSPIAGLRSRPADPGRYLCSGSRRCRRADAGRWARGRSGGGVCGERQQRGGGGDGPLRGSRAGDRFALTLIPLALDEVDATQGA
jgi:hypothetical protein